MSQYIRSCLCGIACIVVAALRRVGIVAGGPAVVLVFFVEEVVNGTSDSNGFQLRKFEGVGQIQVAYEIGVQQVVFNVHVAHVLLAYVLGLQGDLQPL